jgi:putative addiction module component (TIGR02574 family)
MVTVSSILDVALKLPKSERAELAHELLRSLDAQEDGEAPSYEKEWAEEIERRAVAIEGGEMPAEDWRIVMKRLRDSLGGAQSQ